MADIQIYGTLASGLDSGKLARAANIYDEYFGKYQSELNRELERIGDFITDIELSEDVMNLSTTSSSDEIITTFGTINDYKVIVDRLINSKGVYAGFRVTGGKIPVIISASKPDGAYNISLQWVYNSLEHTLSFSSVDGITIACTESKKENFLGWRIDDLAIMYSNGYSGRKREEYRKPKIIGTIPKEKLNLWKTYFSTQSPVLINLGPGNQKSYHLCTDTYYLYISQSTSTYAISTTYSNSLRTEVIFFGFRDNHDDNTLCDVYLQINRPNFLEVSGITYTDPDMRTQEIFQTDFTEVEWGSMTSDPGIVIFKDFWEQRDYIVTSYMNGGHNRENTFVTVGTSEEGKTYSFQIGINPGEDIDGNRGTIIKITPHRLDVDDVTVNGKALLSNPVLSGSDIKVTGYSKPSDSDLSIKETDTVNVAIGKLEKNSDTKFDSLPETILTKPYTVSYAADKQKVTFSTEKAIKDASGSWAAPVESTLELNTPYVLTENIVDNLTSEQSGKVLSANQGKVLQETKINISDIVNDLTTGGATKVLSAQQGVALKNIIDNLIGFEVRVVTSLPATGALGIIYLVAAGEGSGNDVYDEYVWVSDASKYELIGNTRTDLSGYLSKTNTVAYTPTSDYHPATKKYSDDTLNTAKNYTDTSWSWYEGD